MEKTRPILYGVADFAEFRRANAWFIDGTAKSRDMEDIAHAALIEMKYVKAGEPAPTPEQLADIKAKAIAQLDRYSSDPTLVKEWRLDTSRTGCQPVPVNDRAGRSTSGTVTLHRLVLVFHCGDCVLAEEV